VQLEVPVVDDHDSPFAAGLSVIADGVTGAPDVMETYTRYRLPPDQTSGDFMSITMHSASAPVFIRMLNNVLGWLDKAEAHAKARKFDPNNYLSMRLTPDMLPLSAQIQIATDHVKGGLARLAGIEPPKWADDEKTLDALRARIRKAIEYAQSIPAAKLEGSDAREITLPIGPGRTMEFPGEMFLKAFSLPNFFFHTTMTYALLRQGGVELGKMDYLGAP